MKMVLAEGFGQWQTDKRYDAGLELLEAFESFSEAGTSHNEQHLADKVNEHGVIVL
jgi:hypothetical protein